MPPVKQRQIHVIGSLRDFQPPQYAAERGVNFHNLTPIQYTPCQGPSPANNFAPIIPHDHDKQSVESSSVSQLPTFFMTNAQSLGNKFEDIEVVFEQNSVDVAVVTESWFSNNMPENQLDINNYNLFSKHREEKGGGGVAIYVKEDVPASHIDSIIVPSELECLWVKIRPKKPPRSISAIAVCAITTNSPLQPLLMEHLLSSVDHLRSKHPDIGILITGDFNRMNMFQLINGNNLSQNVDFPTRGKATLDLMLTSGNLRECYAKPYPLSLHLASVTILVLFGSLKFTVLPNTSTKRRSLAPYLSLECEHLDLGFKALTGIKPWKSPVLKGKQTLFMKFLIWA